MNKKIKIEIAFGIISIIAIIAGFTIWVGSKQQTKVSIPQSPIIKPVAPTTETDSNCAKEGEKIAERGFAERDKDMPERCCDSLKAIGGWGGRYQGDCSQLTSPSGRLTCTNCGNNICDINNGENKCSCPEDCPTSGVGMGNPASVYCKQNGGKIEIITATDGSQKGYCILRDGTKCDEWAYFRNECDCVEKDTTFSIKNGKVIGADDCKERGLYSNNTFHLLLNNGVTISFSGSKELLRLIYFPFAYLQETMPDFSLLGFSYNDLDVTTSISSPYAIYKPVESVNYKCDGSLVKHNYLNETGPENVPYEYCMTNNIDFLSQYEFNAAQAVVITTGGEITYTWKKIYIRKFNDKNIFFIGNLKGGDADSIELDENKAKYNEITSKNYLDKLLKDPYNAKKIKQWDDFVKNIKLN